MKVVCSYCGKDVCVCDPKDDDRISHGMCPECHQHFSSQWSGMELGEYLERFDAPCMAIDSDGRVLAANKLAGDMIGEKAENIGGLLGEVMECQYSRLPGGCGKTTHCPTCTVRNTIEATISTGKDQICVPTSVEKDSGTLNLQISTLIDDGFIRIQVEPARSGP